MPDPPAGATLADWAHWLAEFIDVLDLAPAHVAGLSLGGGLALELFRRHPEVVRSLILMSACAGWGGSLHPDEVRARLEVTRRNTELLPAQWAPALIETLLPEGSDADLADELRIMLADMHPAATRTSLGAFAAADLSRTLAGVEVPTLMLYGELDVRSPRQVWEPIHEGISRPSWWSYRRGPHGRHAGARTLQRRDPRLRAKARGFPLRRRIALRNVRRRRSGAVQPPMGLPALRSDGSAPCRSLGHVYARQMISTLNTT